MCAGQHHCLGRCPAGPNLVVRALPDQFRVVGLAAGQNLDLLADQVREFNPRMVWANGDQPRDLNGTAWVGMEDMVREPDVDA